MTYISCNSASVVGSEVNLGGAGSSSTGTIWDSSAAGEMPWQNLVAAEGGLVLLFCGFVGNIISLNAIAHIICLLH